MMESGWGGPASAPILQLDGYEGPIDFLLELARAQKVDLGRLSIVALVDQYVAAMEVPGARATLAERGDWLIAASWLVLLKSKLLVNAEDEAEVPEVERLRDSLVRAEQRRQARALAAWLERRPQLGQEVFARGAPEAAPTLSSDKDGDLLDLLLACFDLMEVPTQATQRAERPYAPPVLDVWTLAEALERLRARLSEQPQGGDLGSFLPNAQGEGVSALRRKSGVAGTFLAALELTKQGGSALEQDAAFAPIRVRASLLSTEQAA
ncbi:MAG: ScpA family protein [Roseomonas mucosa]|nr:ScpA family protein [Roseomonas mucosa]